MARGRDGYRPPKPKLSVTFTKVTAVAGEKDKLSAEMDLVNAYDEKYVRFKVDGKLQFVNGSPSIKTQQKKATFAFSVPPKADKALLRVEVAGESAYEELEISPKTILSPATTHTQKTEMSNLSITVSHPIEPDKEFDVTIVTPEINEKVTIGSTVVAELNQIDPPLQMGQQNNLPATLFDLQSGANRTLYLRFKFKGVEAQLQIRRVSTGKIHKHWLVK